MYYTYQEVEDYLRHSYNRVLHLKKTVGDESARPMNDMRVVLKQLKDLEDIVGYFWVEYEEEKGLTMEGKSFVRIENDLYTDDRYALDRYQATKQGITVKEVIEERGKATEMDKEKIDNLVNIHKGDNDEKGNVQGQ